MFGGSQDLTQHKRVDGATVRKDLTKAVKDAGGTDEAIAKGTEKMTKTAFGCGTKELYKETGGKPGKRETLPAEVQKTYIIAETKATQDIKKNEYTGNQQKVDTEIVHTMEEAGKQTRGFLGLW